MPTGTDDRSAEASANGTGAEEEDMAVVGIATIVHQEEIASCSMTAEEVEGGEVIVKHTRSENAVPVLQRSQRSQHQISQTLYRS